MSFQLLPTRALLVACILLTGTFQSVIANEIPWSTDIEGSLQQAAAAGRPVLLEFTADWCMYCKRMEKTTFVDPRVVSFVNQNYVAVRVDADEHKQLVTDLDIKGLPAILVVSPTLQIIDRIPGFQTPEALLTKLQRSSAGSQKQVAQNVAANRKTQAVAARPASAEASPFAQKPKQELQFEPIETVQSDTEEVPVENEGTAKGFQPEFEAVAENESTEPAEEESFDASVAEETTQEEMTTEAEAAESSEEDEHEGFFATVSRKNPAKPEQPSTKAAALNTLNTLDAPEFDGHCLVAAVVDREIIKGSSSHEVKYRGHVLHFSTEEAKQEFLSHPNEYWPLFDGICSVAMINDEERVMGKLEYAAFFRKRLWLFSSEENMKQFLEDPADVAEEMQELAESRSGR